jgi:hypothetical protein
MIGKRQQQRELFDVGNVYPLTLDPTSFHGQLARAAPRLFRDADFAVFYAQQRGRPSVPPSQLALLTLLQHEAGVSAEEAVARSGYDLRWAAVLGRAAGEPLCAKSTLQLFRCHLILHDAVRTLFQQSIQEAKAAGLLKGTPLRIALDTKPILGRGAVEDTYNLLATGIRQLGSALAKPQRQQPADGAREHDLRRYFERSIKGGADLDWSDPEARQAFLTEIVTDARRLLRIAGMLLPALPQARQEAVQQAAHLLEQLLLQDVVEPTGASGSGGSGQAEIREGTVPGRIPSATDPEQRHGRKSKSKGFTGHKATVAVDRESQLIVSADVLSGEAPDATAVKAQVEQVEQNTGQAVAETVGDCAYGSGATRQEFADAKRVLIAKVPQERANGSLFSKACFVIDLQARTVTCPAGVTTQKYTPDKEGGMLFHFGTVCQTCPLRRHCTAAKGGRQIRVHPQEALLQAARAFQQTLAGRQVLRERVVVEHRLARLGPLGIGQARYVGRQKTRFQVLLAATVANLRRTWNWGAAQAARAGTAGLGPGPAGRYGRRWLRLRWHGMVHQHYPWAAAGAT